MSQTIDQRVVEMRFDNAQFEKNIKQSMDSLNQLDRSIDNLEGSDGLSALSNTVGRVGDGFSTMGVVAFTAIQRITNSVIDLGLKLTSKLLAPLNQMKTGGWTRAMNIENAKFQFEGLGMDIQQAMEDAMYAVNETAYSLDAAAMAATQLASSGVKLGDDMAHSLRAISGVAAQTNSSYEDIANVFTRVAGNGRVMGDDLRSLASRGMNAAATLGKAFNKSEADIRKMVSKGQISFEQFSKAMFDAFGEHAVEANNTYSGSLANLNAALSKIGADFQQHKIQNSIRVFNSLRKAINLLRKELSPMAELYGKVYEAFSKGISSTIDYFAPDVAKGLKYGLEGVLNILNNLVTIARIAAYTFKDIFPDVLSFRISDLMKKFRDFTQGLTLTEDKMEKIALILRGVWSAFRIVGIVIEQVVKGLIPATRTCDSLFDILLSGAAIVGALITQFQKWLEESQAVYYIVTALRLAVMITVGAIIALTTKVVELFNKLRQNEQVIRVFEAIKTGIATAVHYIGVAFKYAIEAVMSFISTMRDLGNAASKVSNEGGMSKFAAWLQVIGEKLKDIIKNITPAKVGIALLVGLFAVLAVAVLKLAKSCKSMGEGISGIAKTFRNFNSLAEIVQNIRNVNKANRRFRQLMEFSAMLIIFLHELRKFSEMDIPNIVVGTIAVIHAIAAIVGAALILRNVRYLEGGFERMVKPLISAIVAIGAVLWLAASRDWDKLAAAGGSLVAAILALALVMKALKGIDGQFISGTVVWSIIALSTAILAMGAALNLATRYPWKRIAWAGGAIVVALAAIAGVMFVLSKMQGDEASALRGAGALLLISLTLIPIAIAIRTASKYDWASIGAAGAAIAASLIGLGVALKLMEKLGDDSSKAFAAAGALLLASLSLIPIAIALNKLTSYNWEEMWQKLILVTATITVMGGALAALSELVLATEGMGAVAILAVAAGYFIMGAAILFAAQGVEKFAKAFAVMTKYVDFEKLGVGLAILCGVLDRFTLKALLVVSVLAVDMNLAGIAIFKFAAGVEKLASIDISKLVGNFVEFVNAIKGQEELFSSLSTYMEILAVGLSALAVPLKQLALPAIAFGAAFAIASGGMFVFAAAIRLLVPGLEAFQNLDFVKIAEGIKEISDALLSLAKPGLMLSWFSEHLMRASLAIAGFVVEAVIFNFLDLKGIAAGIGYLAKAFQELSKHSLMLAAAAFQIGVLTVAMYAFNQVMTSVSSVLPEATAIFVRCITVISKSGEYAVVGFIQGLASGIVTAAKTAVLLGKAVVTSLCNFLGIHSPSTFMMKIGEFTGSGFIIGLAENMKEAEEAGTGYGNAVIGTLEGMAGDFFGAGAASGNQVAAGFATSMSAGIKMMLGHLKEAGHRTNMSERGYSSSGYVNETSLTDQLFGNVSGLTKDLFGLDDVMDQITKSAGDMSEGFDSAGGSMEGAGGKAKEAKDEIESLKNTIEGQINLFEEFNKETDLTADKVLENMKSQISGAAEWTNWIHQLGERGVSGGLLKKLAEMGQQNGYKYAKAFMDMSAEQLAQANVFYASSLTIPDNAMFAIQDSFAMAGEWAAYGFANGITPDAAKDEVTLLGLRTLEQLKETLAEQSPSKKTEEMGINYTKGLAQGIISSSPMQLIIYNVNKLADNVLTRLRKAMAADNFKSIGEQVVRGIKMGIEDSKTQSTLFSSVISLCNKVKDAATSPKGFWEHSPSRVFEEIGEYVTLGLAKGISEKSDAPVDAITGVSDDVKSGISTAMDMIRAAFDSDMNITPTIRPVVDLTDVDNGINSINGMLPDGLNIGSSAGRYVPESVNSAMGNEDVVDAVNSLKEDVAYLGESIANIKLVLDTGTMVGAMTPAIDQQLYTRQVYAGRGI